jgi:hypothetical protein
MGGARIASGGPWRAGVGFWLAFSLLVASGAALRLHGIGEQIVLDDEMHSLGVVTRPALEIATHFYESDVSTPLALLQAGIARLVPLDEWTARLPVLFAGIAALVALPLMVHRPLGAGVALIWAALLAIAPQLVYYSRFGRPYMIAALLVSAALLAFASGWRSGGRTGAIAYASCGAMAAWFSPPALPAVLAPLGVATIAALASGRPRARIRALALPGLALAALLAIVFVPPVLTSFAHLTAKVARAHPTLATLSDTALLHAGTRHPALAIAAWLLIAAGAAAGVRRGHGALVAIVLAALAAQALAVWWVAPDQAQFAPVYARYTSCLLPLLALLQALALAEIARPLGRRSGALVVVAWIALLLGFGPLAQTYLRTNNLTNHATYQHHYALTPLSAPEIPPFYCVIAHDPRAYAIVETPWYDNFPSNRFADYQRIHGKPIYVGFPRRLQPAFEGWPFGAPYSFDRFLDLDDPAALARAGVRYVVVHKDLQGEMWNPDLPPRPAPFDVAALREELRARYRRPVFEDGRVAVYQVAGERPAGWPDPDCPRDR